jgi:outer membrane lipoprotein-sorting protein
MRYVLFVLLFLPLPPAALAQENDAEKLYRGMEKKLLAAKAFEVTFDYQVEKGKAKGELLVTRENKVRMKIVGHFAEKPKARFELVSDGKQVRSRGATFGIQTTGRPKVELGGESEWRMLKNFHTVLGSTLSRAGMSYTILLMPYLDGGDGSREIDPEFGGRNKVDNFKLEGSEKVGATQAKRLHYRFGGLKMTLWIDAKTLLPLKRAYVLDNMRIVENYHEFNLDPKIDAKAFELPK